jgi:hypothetical protein
LVEVWPAGQAIDVIHDAAYEPANFNPGVDAAGVLRNPTRFAPQGSQVRVDHQRAHRLPAHGALGRSDPSSMP